VARLLSARRQRGADADVAAVAVFTMQGRSAWLMSKARPAKHILAFTPEAQTYPQLSFLWGVVPYRIRFAETLEQMLLEVDGALIKSGIQPGQQVVLVCGFPVGARRPPNMALLHTVGSEATVQLSQKLIQERLNRA
jgi:pyruvate kinase